jgi:hypothetical protein
MGVVINVRRTLFVIALYAVNLAGDLESRAKAQEHLVHKTDAAFETQVEYLAALDICAALQKIDSLDGSVVAVRGYYRFATELGGLYGRNCPKKLVLNGVQRAQAFHLEYGPVVNDKELETIANRLIQEKNNHEAIQMTVVGKIRARRADLIDSQGTRVRMFGHLGVYPAEITVQVIRDISVVEAPDFPSNMSPNRRF